MPAHTLWRHLLHGAGDMKTARKKASLSAQTERLYKFMCKNCIFLGRRFYLMPCGTCCLRQSILK